jgi:hypothetical protein
MARLTAAANLHRLGRMVPLLMCTRDGGQTNSDGQLARQHPTVAAVDFVAAQPGGAERILRVHAKRSDGMCSGCTVALTRYPCQVARIALIARARLARSNAAQ